MSIGYAVLMDIHSTTIHIRPMAKLKEVKRVSARKTWIIAQIPIESTPLNTTSFSSANTEPPSFLKMELAGL